MYPEKGRARVLIVQERAEVCEGLAKILAERYEVVTAHDCNTAVAAARDHHPDLIVCDEAAGRDLGSTGQLQHFGADPELKTVPVILVRARDGKAGPFEGIDDYLAEPLDAGEALARVALHLELANFRRKARQSEERLKQAEQIAGVGLWEWNIETGQLFWSDRTYRQMGEEPGKFSPTHEAFLQRVHPDDRAAYESFIARVLAGEAVYDCDIRVVHPDGKIRVLHTRGELVPGADEKSRRMVGVCIDVTARKQAEDALRSIAVFPDENPSPVIRIDAAATVVYANRSCSVLAGDWRCETGRPAPDAFARIVTEALNDGQIRKMDVQSGGRVFSFVFAPRTDQEYVNLYGQDITDNRRAQANLAADVAALTRIHALSRMILHPDGMQAFLQEVMDAAVSIAGADRGTLQLIEGESLRIVAHHEHQQPFLEFFAEAESRASVCGEALKRCERVVVNDIESSPLFAATPSLPILRAAGVRAVQSTPMVSRTGTLLGILTTQWAESHRPDEHDLWRIDLLARQAADLIELSRTARDLSASQERLNIVMKSVPVGISFSEDPLCERITGNPEALAQFEVTDGDNLSASAPDSTTPGRQVRYFRDSRELNDSELPLQQAVKENKVVPPAEMEVRLPSGRNWFAHASGAPLKDSSGRIIGGVAVTVDITERKRIEERLNASLREKEVLLREIHHRVKNNLQIVNSLFNLQMANSPDDAIRPILKEMQSRIRSMALVHEKLYYSADVARIDFARYAASLLSDIWTSYGTVGGRVRRIERLQSVELSPDITLPLGLILHELATNTLVHAFPEGRSGEVTVNLTSDKGRLSLLVADNGIGLPAGFNWRNAHSLGLRLVQMLAVQINATVTARTPQAGGTEFEVVREPL